MRRPTILFFLFAVSAQAQHPLAHPVDAVQARYSRAQPVLRYTLRVNAADLSGYDVELAIRNARDTIRLGMVAHAEYDDKYWRFVQAMSAESRGRSLTVTREDSALWRVVAPGGEMVVRYRLQLPPPPSFLRSAWRPSLTPTGGLVGGVHSFMYVVGATFAPSHVTLELPAGWDIATGLEPTVDPHTFFAPIAEVLVESPMMIGRFHSWRFAVDGVPHRVAYWPLPNAAPFDTMGFVTDLERYVRQAVALFGRAPYRDYTFLFFDGTNGALEHANSVTIGAPSATLAAGFDAYLGTAAHEFFHTWNLMRIRPAEYGDVSYRPQTLPRGLWWSEGMSMFYADLLRRRAGLPTPELTRVAHLEALLTQYFSVRGNAHLSAELVSRAMNAPRPDMLGDYDASVHLQGELIGTMLDLLIRDATNNRRSIDDVMRAMLDRFSGECGFTGEDIQRLVAAECSCDVKAFFDAHVRGGAPIDFNRFLRLAGLRVEVTHVPATANDGSVSPDRHARAWLPPGENRLMLIVFDPLSAWARAGLHTGDRISSVNGTRFADATAFRNWINAVRIGDSVRLEYTRSSALHRAAFVMPGYERATAKIVELSGATDWQLALRAKWMAGEP